MEGTYFRTLRATGAHIPPDAMIERRVNTEFAVQYMRRGYDVKEVEDVVVAWTLYDSAP